MKMVIKAGGSIKRRLLFNVDNVDCIQYNKKKMNLFEAVNASNNKYQMTIVCLVVCFLRLNQLNIKFRPYHNS